MGRRVTLALLAGCLALACGGRPPRLAEYRNERMGVALRHPEGWVILVAPEGNWVQIVPPPAGPEPDPLRYAEFISLRVLQARPSESEDALRSIAFSLLPFHGVAKFQREEVAGVERYRFEGTGTAVPAQWAATGVLAVTRRGLLHIVCAKPIDRWRTGQRECDEVIRSVRILSQP